jgi:hypothetical protein
VRRRPSTFIAAAAVVGSLTALYAPWFYRDFARHGVPYEFKGTC